MTMIIGMADRDSIVRYASGQLAADDRQDPVKVAAAAIPLLEWAEQAQDEDDLRARMRAMSRQYANTGCPGGEGRDPRRFVDEAGTLYAFLIAGGGR